SEYDRVALVLPERDVPLLTREVLYTALTRARQSVVVIGDSALLMLGARRTMNRASGIVRKLGALGQLTAPQVPGPVSS
ncbi:MAG: ATP-binding domain-containing protein, partial [Deltaproteobacteria bacterium]|nr:ATP-binding domain-containing protein [Deltaproteobacteria bacterium]